jgi:response regulator of citrate/malate metabolism
MGKLLELLKGISLPPEIEAEVRVLDLRFDQMEARMKAIDEIETRNLDELTPQGEPRYTTQVMTDPSEPTPEEANVLKLMQPPGQQVSAQVVAANLKTNLTTAQYWLSELERKGYVSGHSTRRGFHQPARPPTYSLTDKGIKYLVDHGLTD